MKLMIIMTLFEDIKRCATYTYTHTYTFRHERSGNTFPSWHTNLHLSFFPFSFFALLHTRFTTADVFVAKRKPLNHSASVFRSALVIQIAWNDSIFASFNLFTATILRKTREFRPFFHKIRKSSVPFLPNCPNNRNFRRILQIS